MLTVMLDPVNSAILGSAAALSQTPHNKIPSTAGWLKYRVSTSSKAAAFFVLFSSEIVSSVIQIFTPASATLSSLYCKENLSYKKYIRLKVIKNVTDNSGMDIFLQLRTNLPFSCELQLHTNPRFVLSSQTRQWY